MPERFQFVPEILEIVDLPVEDDDEPSSLALHRLVAFGREVENR
jgi:hypothetical protein